MDFRTKIAMLRTKIETYHLWLLTHVLCIVAHVGMIIAGVVSLITDGESDSIRNSYTTLSWAAFGVGAFGTIFNLVLFFTLLFLLKLSLRGTEEGRFLKKQFAFGLGWLFNALFVTADIGLASALRPEAHANGAVGGTCALAVVSGSMALATITADIILYRAERRDFRAVTGQESIELLSRNSYA